MATVYKVKDGPQGDRTDQGTEMPIHELSAKLANYGCRYLLEDTPHLNVNNPSDYYRHIVIEVLGTELNDKFPRKGFYLVENLGISQAGFLFQ